VHLVGSYSY
jgi:hypothetical protein